MSDKPRCSQKVYEQGLFRGRSCAKPGTLEHEGQWFCSVHYPPNVEARRAALREKHDTEFQARMKLIQAQQDAAAEQKRRAECFPDLLEALELFVRPFEGDHIEAIKADYGDGTAHRVEAGRAAIAKARGQS